VDVGIIILLLSLVLLLLLLLLALQSVMNPWPFYDCLPLVLILCLSSPISNAHCLQIFLS
jgi:hypothetical protein